MNIIITGSDGFIGRNLSLFLKEQGAHTVVEINKQSCEHETRTALLSADFVFHLAGVNRPNNDKEFKEGNIDFTRYLISVLRSSGRKIPLMFSSSIQVDVGNPYGASKAAAEKLVTSYGQETCSPYFIYRFPNVFGKWCRPNYNSFIATFCHNILNNLEITVQDPHSAVTLIYIDDVCNSLVGLLKGNAPVGFGKISPEYETTVGYVVELLKKFELTRDNLIVENVGGGLERALYSTYLSYKSPAQFSYAVPCYEDDRGAFCEILKTKEAGQFSFFTAHPGVTRGGHYHHTKNEKFLVTQGHALFRFRQVVTGDYYELKVGGENPRLVETVPGWSHDITNVGSDKLVVMLWANEIFDRTAPDTIETLL